MPGQLLNRSHRRALHREVRTERVSQDMNALFDPRDTLSSANGFDHAVARDCCSVRQPSLEMVRR